MRLWHKVLSDNGELPLTAQQASISAACSKHEDVNCTWRCAYLTGGSAHCDLRPPRFLEMEKWRQAVAGALDAAAAARRSKFAVKESQSLARVPDTLVFAFEFIMLPTPNEQAGDLEVLRRTILRLHPDLKARVPVAELHTSVTWLHGMW